MHARNDAALRALGNDETANRVHSLCAYGVLALGLVHIAVAGKTYGAWLSPRALFFVGTGLCIMLLGAINLAFLRARHEQAIRALVRSANIAGVALFALGVVALPLPQVFVLLALMVAQTGLSLRR